MENIELQNLKFLLYLVIPLIILLSCITAYKKKEKLIMFMKRNIQYRYKYIKTVLFFISTLLIVISLLQPVVITDERYVEKKGLDIYIFVDISNSMLVEDVEVSRLARARYFINSLLTNLNGDRVGLIPFSNQAYQLLPLTDDYQLVDNFMELLSPDMVSGGGTDIISAVNLGKRLFDRGARGDKVIILISDGEFHRDTANIINELSTINYQGIYLYSLLVGTDEGGFIPVYNENGNKTAYMRDESYNVIVSRADELSMQGLSSAVGGEYFNLSEDRLVLSKILGQFDMMNKTQSGSQKIRDFNELYQYFLLPGFLLFLLAYIIPESVVINEENSN